MHRYVYLTFAVLAMSTMLLDACTTSDAPAAKQLKVSIVLDIAGENDKSFNEYSLKGAKEAATEKGLDFSYVVSQSTSDYEINIETQIAEGANLVITIGFLMGDATKAAAIKHPDVKFAIVDVAYYAGNDGKDPYANELNNVTSLMFAEDEAAYLAGVLASCTSKTGVIATVAGMEIPPVVRFVTGYRTGAKSVNPNIVTLNQYIPDFNDLTTGKTVGEAFISQKADVIFGVGGNTGNGGLLAAKEAGIMGIGVDTDQYLSYPEVKDVLITSAMKNVDTATGRAVRDFAAGKLTAGIKMATLSNDGVGLAPYHDWDGKISADCKAKVSAAIDAVKANPKITGGK
jgi:basic membrane protein A